jgi:hypothetical protein
MVVFKLFDKYFFFFYRFPHFCKLAKEVGLTSDVQLVETIG